MSEVIHLTDEQLVRAIDGEITAIEQADIDAHLVRCEACLERWEATAEFSNEVERAIDATAVRAPRGARERLMEAMESERANAAIRPGRRVHAWWWAAAAAASIAIILFALHGPGRTAPKQEAARVHKQGNPSPAATRTEDSGSPAAAPVPERASRKELRAGSKPRQGAGDPSPSAFLRLPYTDAELPMQAAGLVRVRMQLSMLANAGVIHMSPGAPDAPVEADVLLGIDGQPYAIRLVSAGQ